MRKDGYDIPCVRHGVAGTEDSRLVELLEVAHARAGARRSAGLADSVRSLTWYQGQVWVTWKHAAARAQHAELIDHAWRSLGESGPVLHLIPCNDAYDYQEDVMNNSEDH